LEAIAAGRVVAGELEPVGEGLGEAGVGGEVLVEDRLHDVGDVDVLEDAAGVLVPQERQGRFDRQAITREAAVRAQRLGACDEAAADDFFFAAVPPARLRGEDADLRGQPEQGFEFDASFRGLAGDFVAVEGACGMC
jgi:hypothetical protein